MLLKGCLHTHTTCSDGELTPQALADVYAGLGYDFVAFTDHDFLMKPGSEKDYDRVRTDMILLKGMELTLFEKGYLHVTRIHGDEEVLHVLCHLGNYDLGLDQVLERIETLSARIPLDAVEITTQGFPSPEFDVPEIPYPKVASDDAHTRAGCGRAWIEMDARRDKDAILRAVKKGRFWNCYTRG